MDGVRRGSSEEYAFAQRSGSAGSLEEDAVGVSARFPKGWEPASPCMGPTEDIDVRREEPSRPCLSS